MTIFDTINDDNMIETNVPESRENVALYASPAAYARWRKEAGRFYGASLRPIFKSWLNGELDVTRKDVVDTYNVVMMIFGKNKSAYMHRIKVGQDIRDSVYREARKMHVTPSKLATAILHKYYTASGEPDLMFIMDSNAATGYDTVPQSAVDDLAAAGSCRVTTRPEHGILWTGSNSEDVMQFLETHCTCADEFGTTRMTHEKLAATYGERAARQFKETDGPYVIVLYVRTLDGDTHVVPCGTAVTPTRFGVPMAQLTVVDGD